MLQRSVRLQHHVTRLAIQRLGHFQRRQLLTLAIETSCDDTCVAILEKKDALSRALQALPSQKQAVLHFNEKVTASNICHGGIHPIVSLESHWSNLARLANRSLRYLPDGGHDLPYGRTISLEDGTIKQKPDFISVTRGPGMRSNLVCGLDTAKGLSTAWQIPMLGVHHMQAHALTPRLVHALNNTSNDTSYQPAFPFLTLLISGGHTMLLHSQSVTSHTVLAPTNDIAIGDCLDKCGRAILPSPLLSSLPDTAYAKHLSTYAFPNKSTYTSHPIPHRRGDEISKPPNTYGWAIQQPLANTKDLAFSFSGIASYAAKLCTPNMSDDERLMLARTVLGTAFEHLASRTVLTLQSLSHPSSPHTPISTLVVSGGVAANPFLRYFLRTYLDVRGYKHIDLIIPSIELCTDNAAMIAWAGMEMYEAGYRTSMSCEPRRKWSMDDGVGNGEEGGDGAKLGGGILGVGGWEMVHSGREGASDG